MNSEPPFEIFMVCAPGLEAALGEEARDIGFVNPRTETGGVAVLGHWPDVWRANLHMRGAARVMARFASFRALHLAQLDKRARKVEWANLFRPDVPVRVEATCRRSRIYHGGAASERIATALSDALGVPIAADAPLTIKVRIENDLVTLSVDTSGEGLHKRGYKQAVNAAPMRETLAALFLRQCGYQGLEPVFDPMCGSGTFVIEAAEIAAGLMPGRGRHFAFEHLVSFDRDRWYAMRAAHQPIRTSHMFYGSDRDSGAIAMSVENAKRAGVAERVRFTQARIIDAVPPDRPPGLVIVNPPYGTRLGDKKDLYALYGALGAVLKQRFGGWRVGLVTSQPGLAKATGLDFETPVKPVDNNGLRIGLYRTGPLRSV